MNIQNLPWRKTAVLHADKTRSVMIVDDHEIFRNGLRSLLAESETFRIVAEASNCEDALIHLQSLPIDLVLLDLHLPDVNCMEALHRLKKKFSIAGCDHYLGNNR